MTNRQRLLLAAAALSLAALAVGGWRWSRELVRQGGTVLAQSTKIPLQIGREGYAGSASCQDCHPNEHRSWHASYHRTMTQLATRETVVAPIDGEPLTGGGWQCRFYYDGDQLRASVQDRFGATELMKADAGADTPPGTPLDVPIVMSTGSHHMQLYWAAVGSVLTEVPFYYRIADQRWVPKNDTFLGTPSEQTLPDLWNINCIHCHSVAGQPRRNEAEQKFESQVAEVGIACEACHGPAASHVEYYSASDEARHALTNPSAGLIVNPAKCAPHVASQICAKCHCQFLLDPTSFTAEGSPFRPGDLLEDTRILSSFDVELVGQRLKQAGRKGISSLSDDMRSQLESYRDNGYWPDGTVRVGGDEFLGMAVSKCYTDGELSCLSCHSMHQSDPNDQLARGMETDQACLQCHSEFAKDISLHTHHPPESSGSRCYNCHMPHTTFALLTAMRSHRIDSPRAVSASAGGRPNACNLCHLDKTLEWTSNRLAEWYESPENTDLDDDDRQVAASVLWLLKGNLVQRAIAAWHLGWSPALAATGDRWQGLFLAHALNDPVSAVRYVAGRSLLRLPGFESFHYDYVSEEAERRQAQASGIELWTEQQIPDLSLDEPALLIGPDGRADERRIGELKSRQDKTEIFLPE